MSKKQAVEERVLGYFETAPLNVAEVLLNLVKAMVKKRLAEESLVKQALDVGVKYKRRVQRKKSVAAKLRKKGAQLEFPPKEDAEVQEEALA